MTNAVIVLDGDSESGKSTAGAVLAFLGAHRLKLRRVLIDELETGRLTEFCGWPTRVEFQSRELASVLIREARERDAPLLVESALDLEFADNLHDAGVNVIVAELRARPSVRASRVVAATGAAHASSLQELHRRDREKSRLRRPAKRATRVTIDNNGDRVSLVRSLVDLWCRVGGRDPVVESQIGVVLHRSAGGVVVRERNGAREFLLLHQVRKTGEVQWVFPKGHIELSETPHDAAIRETREETGLSVGEPAGSLGVQVFSFRGPSSALHVKEVSWFMFIAPSDASVVPRADEGFDAHQWCTLRDALRLLTHVDSREWLRRASEFLKIDDRSGSDSNREAGGGIAR